jgi:dTDP-4-amino-4,6-dideoxygalactose transaminase
MWRRSRRIADNYNLKVIYDAAHAFGVQDTNGSVLRHGDLSVLSFHATKVFNTFEGGAIISPDEKTKIRIDQLKNFGHVGETTVVAAGINGKMSEFNAALGSAATQAHCYSAIALRRDIDGAYRAALQHVRGIRCLEKSGEVVLQLRVLSRSWCRMAYGLTREELNQSAQEPGYFSAPLLFPAHLRVPDVPWLAQCRQGRFASGQPGVNSQILCLPIYP